MYLPKGAQLVESLGFDDNSVQTYEEADHAVLEGTFKLQPLNQAKLKFTYTIPYTDAKQYKVYIQKQGGSEDIPYVLSVNGGEQNVTLDKDVRMTVPF